MNGSSIGASPSVFWISRANALASGPNDGGPASSRLR